MLAEDAITSTSLPQLYHETETDVRERWMAVGLPGSLRLMPCFSPRERSAEKGSYIRSVGGFRAKDDDNGRP